MTELERLRAEMKTLMDLEVIRMQQRHAELMWWAAPRMVLIAVLIVVLVYLEARFK